MEEESKMSFWKKIKTSILGLEEYQKLALQKVTKAITYLAILMLIFAFFVTLSITYRFHKVTQEVADYIENNIQTLEFQQGQLLIAAKDKPKQEPIIIEEENYLNGQIIIDTNTLTQEQINSYKEQIKNYANGIIIVKDAIYFKVNGIGPETSISLTDISNQFNIVNIQKSDIINFLRGNQIYQFYVAFFIALYIGIFINFLATTLLDVILYSAIAYIVGICTHIRLRYIAAYNIAAYSLTLPILLNIVYAVLNILTGYTISYFDIMYMAISCIYIITAILMMKADIIKRQMELSKIIAEQEKVKQEIARKELEKKEEEEKERLRKEDEKKRQEEKEKEGKSKEEKNGNKLPKGKQEPEPQANIGFEK